MNGPSKSREFSFTANGTNGQQIVATFKLEDVRGGATNNLGTAVFTYTLGTWTTTYSNTASSSSMITTIATPYPSIINVSSVGGVVIKATVTLTNLSHLRWMTLMYCWCRRPCRTPCSCRTWALPGFLPLTSPSLLMMR